MFSLISISKGGKQIGGQFLKVFSTSSSSSSTTTSSASASTSTSSSSVLAASALFDAASTISPPPFARPQASGARLVAAIAERAAERTRASKADESLDKEASIATGRLMPALRNAASDDALKSSALSRSKVESVHVGAEALGRIERAMAGRGVSAGTRAGVRAVLAQKAAETAKASEAQSPLARLSSLKRSSEALGYKLPLTGKESSLLRSMEREQAALLKKGNSAMGGGGFFRGKASSMRIPAPPLDLAASTLKSLTPDGKVLKRVLVQSDRRADLMQRAKTLLSVSSPSALRPL
jgi:hypothetical protein